MRFCASVNGIASAGLKLMDIACNFGDCYKFGICDWHNEMFAIQKNMKERSDSIYVIADSSKFETKALMKIDDAKICRCFITDNELPSGIRELYAENGLNIITD